MIPLFKVVSLLIRLFTKPISNYLKSSLKLKNDHHPVIKRTILNLGQFYHNINIRIQRRLMNMTSTDTYIKPLSDEKALDSGAEFIGEILAYGTLITWGIYEVNKYSNEAKAKEHANSQVLANIHARIQGIEANNQDLLKIINEIKEQKHKNIGVDEEVETD